jgi:choline-sulfatase
MGLHGHLYFDRGKNINQGFDEWVLAEGLTFNATTDKHVTSDKLTNEAIKLLSRAENSSKQFFMWIHYMDPHDEYLKHAESPDFGKKNRDRYDSEVFFTDLHIGRLLDFARQQSWWQNTCVIVTADHGEAFGEHGMYKHAFELWEVLTHVPLIMYVPGAKPRDINARRSAIDLAPTIVDLMGIPVPGEFVGKSLTGELFGGPPADREPIVLDIPEDKNSAQRRAIISGDYKLIVRNQGANTLLFNLKDDPGELTDLSKKDPATLTRMKALFEATSKQIPEIEPYGNMKLASGKIARGTEGPATTPSGTAPNSPSAPAPSSSPKANP